MSTPLRRAVSDGLERAGAGAKFGLLMAAFYVAYVAGLYLLRGSAPFDRHGVTFGAVVLSYVAGGLTAGAIVGLLHPLTVWRFGSVLVATLAAFAVVFGGGVAAEGPPWRWGAVEWGSIAVLAAVFGLVLGNVYYRKPAPGAGAADLAPRLRTVRPPRGRDTEA